jgi:hypothetical protein
VHKNVGRKSTNGEFSLSATQPQQYRELSNPKIENRRCCCMLVLDFAQRKGVHEKVCRKSTKRGILFKGNTSPTVPVALESEDRKQALLLCACPRLCSKEKCAQKGSILCSKEKCARKGGQELDGTLE